MALATVLFSMAACRDGWTPLGSRCVYQTAGNRESSACAADCASVVRPWVANDTGGVLMCIQSQDEYDFLDSWVGHEYWTGFQRLGASDGVTPPADWRTGVVHPQGAACSAGANPWFDSLMSHQRASPLLEHCTARPAPHHLRVCECTAVSEDHPVWNLREPSNADTNCFDDANGEQNCILRDKEKWRSYFCTIAAGETASSGWWCAEASPNPTPTHGPAETAEQRAHAVYPCRRTSRCEIRVGFDAESTPACLCEVPDETLDPCESVPQPPPARAPPVVPHIVTPPHPTPPLPTFASRFRPSAVTSLSPAPRPGIMPHHPSR